MSQSIPLQGMHYEIHYAPLFATSPELSFPCDAEGHVSIDLLSNRARNNYFYARTVIGREYAPPAVLPCEMH